MRYSWLLVLAALSLPACKGNTGGFTNATPPVTTPACERTTVLQRASALPANGYVYLTFATTQVGRLEVTVDWTFAASPISVYLVEEACTIEHLTSGGNCAVLTFSQSGPKPRRATHFAAGPGRFALIVTNGGEVDDSVSMQVTLASTGCPTITSTGDAHAR